MNKVNFADFIGHRFGILEIIGQATTTKHGQMAVVKCDCGTEKIYPLTSLRINRYGSCGCLMKKRQSIGNIIHGLSTHPLYGVFRNMKLRCYDENDKAYKRYGGIGVRICDLWLNNPIEFIKWGIENGWKIGLHIDKDIKGNGLLYSPENCCFVTPLQNQNNRHCTRRCMIDGITYTWGEVVKKYSLNYSSFANRLKMGWDVKLAIETPVRYTSRGKLPLIH